MKFFIPITLLLLASTFAIHADLKKSLRSEMTGIDAFNVGTMTMKKGNTEHSISCLTFSTDEPVFSQFSKDSWYDRNFHGDNAFEFKTDPIYGLVFIEKPNSKCKEEIDDYFIKNEKGQYVLPFEYIRAYNPGDYSFKLFLSKQKETELKDYLTINFLFRFNTPKERHILNFSYKSLLDVVKGINEKKQEQYGIVQNEIDNYVKEYKALKDKEYGNKKKQKDLEESKTTMTKDISTLASQLKEKEEKSAETVKKTEVLKKEYQEQKKKAEMTDEQRKAGEKRLAQLKEESQKKKVKKLLENLKPFITNEEITDLQKSVKEELKSGKELTNVVNKILALKINVNSNSI